MVNQENQSNFDETSFENEEALSLALSKHIDGELSPTEADQLKGHLSTNKLLSQELKQFETVDSLLKEAFYPGLSHFDDSFAKKVASSVRYGECQRGGFSRFYKGLVALAASVLLAITIFSWDGEIEKGTESTRTTFTKVAVIEGGNGQISIIRDGENFNPSDSKISLRRGDIVKNRSHSVAVINTANNSTISLGINTQVRLSEENGIQVEIIGTGRIFCDISSQSVGKQFSVRTKELDITVMGTHFLVEKIGSMSKVTVLEGKVKCIPLAGGKGVYLGPNQRGILVGGGELYSEPQKNVMSLLRWLPNYEALGKEFGLKVSNKPANRPENKQARPPEMRPGGIKRIDGSMDGPVEPPKKK